LTTCAATFGEAGAGVFKFGGTKLLARAARGSGSKPGVRVPVGKVVAAGVPVPSGSTPGNIPGVRVPVGKVVVAGVAGEIGKAGESGSTPGVRVPVGKVVVAGVAVPSGKAPGMANGSVTFATGAVGNSPGVRVPVGKVVVAGVAVPSGAVTFPTGATGSGSTPGVRVPVGKVVAAGVAVPSGAVTFPTGATGSGSTPGVRVPVGKVVVAGVAVPSGAVPFPVPGSGRKPGVRVPVGKKVPVGAKVPAPPVVFPPIGGKVPPGGIGASVLVSLGTCSRGGRIGRVPPPVSLATTGTVAAMVPTPLGNKVLVPVVVGAVVPVVMLDGAVVSSGTMGKPAEGAEAVLDMATVGFPVAVDDRTVGLLVVDENVVGAWVGNGATVGGKEDGADVVGLSVSADGGELMIMTGR